MSGTSLLPWRRPRLNVIVLHGMIAARVGMLNADSARPLIEKALCVQRPAAGHPGYRKSRRVAGAIGSDRHHDPLRMPTGPACAFTR